MNFDFWLLFRRSLLLFLLPLQLLAGPALPPLVPGGENLADFPDQLIDRNTPHNSIAFKPNSQILISGSNDRSIRLWSTYKRTLLSKLEGHLIRVDSVNFNNNGENIVSGAMDNTIKLWDAQQQNVIHTFEHQGWINSATFSSNSKIIASSSSDNKVKIWDAQKGELLHEIGGLQDNILSIDFSPDDKIVALGSGDSTIKLWNIQTKTFLSTLRGHKDSVWSVNFSYDGKYLVSGSSDKTVKLWDIGLKQLLHTFSGHQDSILTTGFSPDGKMIASGSTDKTVKVWDAQTARLLHTFQGHQNDVQTLSFDNIVGTLLASGSADRTIKLWDTQQRSLLHTLQGHKTPVISVKLHPLNSTIIISISENTIKLWNIKEKKLLHSFQDHRAKITSAKFSHDGKIIASTSEDGAIKLWDIQQKKLIKTIKNQKARGDLSFTSDGKALAFASAENFTSTEHKIKIWNFDKNQVIHEFEGHKEFITAISFSHDGSLMVTGAFDNTVKLWDVKQQSLLYTYQGHQSTVNSVIFSPDGKNILSGSSDSTIKLWDIQKKRLLHTFEGHGNSVQSAAFSPDGNNIISGSSDNTIKLWDKDKRSLINTFQELENWALLVHWVNSVIFNHNGKTIISGSEDGTIKLWDIKTQKLLHTLIGGSSGTWLSINEIDKTFQRGDDGTLLLERNGKDLQPALPKSFDKTKVKPPKLRRERSAPIAIASGETQDLTFEVTNTSQQTLYWPKIELAEDSPFSRHSFPGEAPNTIAPGKTTRVHVKIGAHLDNPPKPEQRTLKLRLVAPNQTASEWLEIPVQVNTPQLEITEASLLKDENIIKVRIDNKGTQGIRNTFYKLDPNLPGLTELDTQNAEGIIEPGSFIERSFSLPPGFEAPKDHQIKLDIRNAELPFMVWEFNPKLTLAKPPIWMYAGLALLAMLSALGIFYFRRYRHPLLVGLSEQPQSLLKLPLEQLPEAQQRLQQTRRLDTVLADASVSQKTLHNALDFNDWSAAEKAEYICQRVGGVLDNTLTPTPLPHRARGLTVDSDMPPLALRERGPGGEGETGVFALKTPLNFPLNIDKLLLHFPTEAPEDVFQTLKTNPDTQNKITLIIGPDSAYQRKLYNTTKQLDNKWVAPQSSELTRLLLSPNPENTLAEILSGQLSLQQISPYRVGGGVSNESVFFGRRELIAQITNRDPANYLMVGGRQVGKSTLLKALERRYTDNPQIQCHYLTLSNEVLVPRLAALLKLDKTSDPEVLASRLDERIRQDGQHYIFLIDEADRFIEHEKAQDYPILNVFRRLSEEGNCVFILAGFWQLYQHAVLDYQSPIRNFGELLSVGALEKPACIELATEPMRSMNLHWDNDTLPEQLVTACGQRANLIAIACQHIVRNLPPQQRNITAGDMHKALHSDEIRRALSGWVVGISEEEQIYERMVVYATIEREYFTTADLLQLAQQHELQLDTQQLEKTLSRLELAFILQRNSGRRSYRVPLFVDYIREDVPAAKLEAEFLRLKS